METPGVGWVQQPLPPAPVGPGSVTPAGQRPAVPVAPNAADPDGRRRRQLLQERAPVAAPSAEEAQLARETEMRLMMEMDEGIAAPDESDGDGTADGDGDAADDGGWPGRSVGGAKIAERRRRLALKREMEFRRQDDQKAAEAEEAEAEQYTNNMFQ